MKKRVCNNETELYQCIKEAWFKLEPTLLTSLVDSMPRRILAVIEAGGAIIKY